MTIVVAVVAVAAVLWIVRDAVTENSTADGAPASAGASVAKTPWGEPDLSGVWKGEIVGARDGRDTFNLTTLEGLYTADARARMKQLSAKDDPALQCAPLAFPRAAMLGQPLQIIQSPGFTFVFTQAYPAVRIIPTTGRPHTAEQYLFPSHLGDSTAHWDGDTLVIDVISFNGEGWLDLSRDAHRRALASDRCGHARVPGDSRRPANVDDALGDAPYDIQASARRQNRRGTMPAGGWPGDLSRASPIVSAPFGSESRLL
jgi:hypothetical protein